MRRHVPPSAAHRGRFALRRAKPSAFVVSLREIESDRRKLGSADLDFCEYAVERGDCFQPLRGCFEKRGVSRLFSGGGISHGFEKKGLLCACNGSDDFE